MAFNPFVSFQKNRRFWMAGILLICMISFVFFGFKGGCDDRVPKLFGRSGPAVASIDGSNISRRELDDLKIQRNLANAFMKTCADRAYKNVSKRFFEQSKDVDKDKNIEKRRDTLTHLVQARITLGMRKDRLRYFDIGVKFDDLLEFKLWQLEADRLGIQIEKEHLDFLFASEFFGALSPDELMRAQLEAQREFRDAGDAFVRRAVGEEFRVKIAQYAILSAQPNAYRKKHSLGEPKYSDPDLPDEVRAPMTLAQVFEFYKAQRAAFGVTLIPVHVQPFVDNQFVWSEFARVPYPWAKPIREPDEQLKRDFFDANKSASYDPSSDRWGLEIPPQIRIEYVLADPMSPRYADLATFVNFAKFNSLNAPNPVAFDAFGLEMYGNLLIAQRHRDELEAQYKAEVSVNRFRGAARYSERDITTPVLAHFAARHPQAVMSLIGASITSPTEAMAGYLAWGKTKAPLEGTIVENGDKDKTKLLTKLTTHEAEFDAAVLSEMQRRAPAYAKLLFSGASDNPLDMMFPYLTMDTLATLDEFEKFGQRAPLVLPLERLSADPPNYQFAQMNQYPRLTLETAQIDLERMIAQQTAREWAQENILIVKSALEQAAGDSFKFKKELARLESELNLTYGPPDAAKSVFHDRFSVNDAPEFEILRDAFVKQMDLINLFEGREGARVLKAGDFYKMFFDGTELFAASAKYRAMPWPPEVKPDNTRDLQVINPRLAKNVSPEEMMRFRKHLNDNDPNQKAPGLHLYKTADRPILFWRTDELNATRLKEYREIETDLEKYTATRAKLEGELKMKPKNGLLQRELAKVKKEAADLERIKELVTKGFKFERARKDEALPKAAEIAKNLINATIEGRPAIIHRESVALKQPLVTLTNLSPMHKEEVAGLRFDYFPPSLPKDTFKPHDYPRDNLMEQVLSLYDLKAPLKTGNPDVDDVNKELYELAKTGKAPDRFVQIITNKPRSIFYVAAVTSPPDTKNTFPFRMSMFGAPYSERRPDGMQLPRDLFVDRAQEQQAKAFRADFIRGLRETHDLKIVDSDARKNFDGGGD